MDFKQLNSYDRPIKQVPGDYLVHRKILVEEIFQDLQSNTAFIRKINCQEIYDCQKETLLENTSQIDSFVGSTDRFMVNPKFQNGLLNHSINSNFGSYKSGNPIKITTATEVYEETPMDIDSSNDQLIVSNRSAGNMNNFRKRKSKRLNDKNISMACTNNEIYSNVVPINQPLISRFSTTLLILILLLTLAGVYIVIAGDHFIYVNKEFQLENIKKELQERVLHQNDAVKIVVKTFEQMDLWREGLKVLPFVGSTGVGKTFTVNIIKKHFFPHLVQEVDGNHLTNMEKQQRIISNLWNCCCNLIIIDNLKASDLNNFINFVANLPRSHILLIIPIFNIQDTVDGLIYEIKEDNFKFIRNEFEQSGLYYELVLFDMLKLHVIEEWLRKELNKRQISESRHESLVKLLLDSNNAKYKGFKGLNSKLLLALDGK